MQWIFVFHNFAEFIYYNIFLMESLEFLNLVSLYLWKEITLFLPFQFGCIFFSWLIALARTSDTMLNRSHKKQASSSYSWLQRKSPQGFAIDYNVRCGFDPFLNFVYGVRPNFIYLSVDIWLSQQYLLKKLFFPH